MNFSSKWKSERETSLFCKGVPKTQRQFFYKYYYMWIAQFIRKWDNIPKSHGFYNPTIIDLGCGRGTISQYLYNSGFTEILAVDKEETATDIAVKNLRTTSVDVLCEDIFNLPKRNICADIIISIGVVEHVDMEEFYRLHYKLLKDGGMMISLYIPDKFSIQSLNIFGNDRYSRTSEDIFEHKMKLYALGFTDIQTIWVNPYPLFTPVPLWMEYPITLLYRFIMFIFGRFTGPKCLSQACFVVARKP